MGNVLCNIWNVSTKNQSYFKRQSTFKETKMIAHTLENEGE